MQARTVQELRALGAQVLAQRASALRPDEVAVTAAGAGQGEEGVDETERFRPSDRVDFVPSLNETVDAAPGKRIYARIEADWDPARSSGVWNMPSDALFDSGDHHRMNYNRKSTKEKIGFFVPDGAGGHTLEDPPGKTRTSSSRTGDSARAPIRHDAEAAIHWHLDRDSKGYVDNPDDPRAKEYGDTGYLRNGKPIATAFKGEVGWHGLENGRLVFLYPSGTMSQAEIDAMQENLNREQKMFYRRK